MLESFRNKLIFALLIRLALLHVPCIFISLRACSRPGHLSSLQRLLIIKCADVLLNIRKIFTGVFYQTLRQQRALLHQFPLLDRRGVLHLRLAVRMIGYRITLHTLVLSEFVFQFRAVSFVIWAFIRGKNERSIISHILGLNILKQLPLIVLKLLWVHFVEVISRT